MAATGTETITCVKKLAESPKYLNSIPSNYVHCTNPTENSGSESDSIPTIDLSLLTSDDHNRKSEAIQALDRACKEWGFFTIVNHGIPERLMSEILEVANEFFSLSEDEKPEFQPKNVLEPIRYGTSFNTEKEEIFFWRDFLKVFVHPQFHCPDKPESFRDLLKKYSERIRGVVRTLLKGLSESLALEEAQIEKALNLSSALQIFVANFYPKCPIPETALGMPPHSDHGLLTLLIQNQVGGLQIQHNGKWVNVSAPSNSILVNIADHLEIFSNGKYKSVLHRAVVNNQKTRISIAMANGPSLDTVVRPVSGAVSNDSYVLVKYEDYLLAQQSNKLDGKAFLKQNKIRDE